MLFFIIAFTCILDLKNDKLVEVTPKVQGQSLFGCNMIPFPLPTEISFKKTVLQFGECKQKFYSFFLFHGHKKIVIVKKWAKKIFHLFQKMRFSIRKRTRSLYRTKYTQPTIHPPPLASLRFALK